jgi:hypothetical protein
MSMCMCMCVFAEHALSLEATQLSPCLIVLTHLASIPEAIAIMERVVFPDAVALPGPGEER